MPTGSGYQLPNIQPKPTQNSEVEKYLKKSNLLEDKPNLLRLDVMQENADEPRLIEGIKHLIGE